MSEIPERNGGYGGPDPTALTSQLVMRELTSLRELLESRLDGMDKAQTLFHNDLVRVPTSVDKSVGQLKELHEKMFAEKFGTIEERLAGLQSRMDDRFRNVQSQFNERDERVKQAALDTKEAIAQQQLLHTTTSGGLRKQIDDVKELVLRGEGRQTGMSSSLGTIFAVIGAIGVISAILLALWKQ